MSFKLKRSKNQLEERRDSLCVKSDPGGVVKGCVLCHLHHILYYRSKFKELNH